MSESPVRLAPEIKRALRKHYGKEIKQHSLSYAANVALAKGLGVAVPLTPREKMAKASKTRWRAAKRASKTPAKKRARKAAE